MSLRPNAGEPQIDLGEVVRDPSRIANVDQGQIPALLAQLSAVQASMTARLLSAEPKLSDGHETLLTVSKAAERLAVSEDWLYRRTDSLPFVVRVGRHVRFSASAIDRYIRNRLGR